MMKLSQAASYFNNTTFADAHAPGTTFMGRLLPYDDNSRDSLSTERRIMSVTPSVAIPARRVVDVAGQKYIVGQSALDIHGDDVMRKKYILHQADEQAQVRTFSEALSGTGSKNLWANRLWVKETKESEESSGVYDAYQIYFSSAEDIRDTSGTYMDGRDENVLVRIGGRWHLVRATFSAAGGFLVAVADELPDPVVLDVTFTKNQYNPTTDTKTPTNTTVKGVNLRWQSGFTYLAQYSEKYLPGDSQIIVLKTAVTSPAAGDNVTVQGRKYTVVTVIDQAPVWSLHLRHA